MMLGSLAGRRGAGSARATHEVEIMHYPRRNSRIKRKRTHGFRARMRTSKGRKLINRKRRHGFHRVTVSAKG